MIIDGEPHRVIPPDYTPDDTVIIENLSPEDDRRKPGEKCNYVYRDGKWVRNV